jgi:hypothetical protein
MAPSWRGRAASSTQRRHGRPDDRFNGGKAKCGPVAGQLTLQLAHRQREHLLPIFVCCTVVTGFKDSPGYECRSNVNSGWRFWDG